jgi:uncharacterized membrane protein YecN with MAPEG domain
VSELIQNVVDGLGRGSTYALFALGISLMFGVMHLVNFAQASSSRWRRATYSCRRGAAGGARSR